MCNLRSVGVCFRVCIVCDICDVSVIYANRLYILLDLHESICSQSRCMFMIKKDTRKKKANPWENIITERTFTVFISINFILWFLTRHFIYCCKTIRDLIYLLLFIVLLWQCFPWPIPRWQTLFAPLFNKLHIS